MRTLALLFFAVLSTAAYAADEKTEAAPSSPPSSEADQGGFKGEPQITITKKNDQTIEEYRMHGKLYMIKVTPKHGKPYYLVDDRGDGKFSRQESLDFGLRVPQWVIYKF